MILAPCIIPKFFDNNGQPLAKGLLFSYVAGTTTKQATYQDNTSGNPNTNPIVLDFRGECQLWLDTTKTYKFVLAPATDTDPPTNPIKTVDNVAGGYGGTIDWLQIVYAQTDAELAKSITPVSLQYPENHAFRYMNSTQIADVIAKTYTQDVTTALQNCFDLNSPYLPNGGYKTTTDLQIKASNFCLKTESQVGVIIQPTSAVTHVIRTYNTSRSSGTAPTFIQNLIIAREHGITIDMTNMTNASTSYGMLIEDSFYNSIGPINIIDPLNEASNRYGVIIGRAVFDTSLYDVIGGISGVIADTIVSSVVNFSTTIKWYNYNGWGQKLRYCQAFEYYSPTLQKDHDKFDMDLATGPGLIVGGDFEQSGNFIRVTTAGSVSNIRQIGGQFGGFTGTLFGGAAGRPQSSLMDVDGLPIGTRPLASVTRSGTTATATVNTTLVNGIFKYQVPTVGQYITVSGWNESVFNVSAIVLTSNSGTNVFTYAVANSGATTGTGSGSVQTDATINYRYIAQFENHMRYDSTASRFLWDYKHIVKAQTPYSGFKADGSTEVPLIQVDGSDRMALGPNLNYIDDNGNFRNTTAGKGFTLTSPDGTQTKQIQLSNAGALVLV